MVHYSTQNRQTGKQFVSRFSAVAGSKVFGLALLALILVFTSCGLFRQAKEYERFVHSRFSVRDVKVLSIAGIDVSQIKKTSDLNFGQMITLGLRFIKGDMPSVMEISVKGKNPFSGKAAISGMDWLLQMKSDTLASGTINRKITILPGETTLFPVKVNFNLSRLLKSGSLKQIMKVMLGDAGKEEYERLGLVFKIRPWYRLGSKIKKSPVYISIHPKFEQVSLSEKH
jgi:hypothetical protein